MLRGCGVQKSTEDAVDILVEAFRPDATDNDLYQLRGLVRSIQLPDYPLAPPYDRDAITKVVEDLSEVLSKIAANDSEPPGKASPPGDPLRHADKAEKLEVKRAPQL